jgi:hypothetical protein
MLRTGILPLLLILTIAFGADATMMRAVPFDEKVENAGAIVLGKCTAQQSSWDNTRRRILTYSTFDIEETIKGVPSQQITIVTPGGTVGTVAQQVVGVPQFREGDEHVLFVRESSVGPTVAYLEQGSYRVFHDRGERIVQPSATGEVAVDHQRGLAVADRPQTLRTFKQRVRETERRREALRMEVLEREAKERASLWNQLRRNKTLVVLALIGVALATWQLVKRH